MAADRELPERFRAAAALGAARMLLLHSGDDRIDEAMKLAGQARTLAPKSLAVWEVLSLGYCREGHFRRAAGAARRVLAPILIRRRRVMCARGRSAHAAPASGPGPPLKRPFRAIRHGHFAKRR